MSKEEEGGHNGGKMRRKGKGGEERGYGSDGLLGRDLSRLLAIARKSTRKHQSRLKIIK
jgi:hypothetical protein